jgi:hypothetical protein
LEPLERDPEFRTPTPAERLIPYDAEPQAYLRLVANPFLSVFAFLLWLVAMRWLLRADIPGPLAPLAILFGVGGLVAPFLLLHYHCLDCGGTGRISRWRDHTCPSVIQRRREGRIRSIRGPTPPFQVVLWLWVALGLGVTLNALISAP